MKKALQFAVLVSVAFLTLSAPLAAAQGATARYETVTIPTFEMGPADPAPEVFQMDDWNRSYPRSAFRIDTRAEEPVDREYRMAVLENDLLRVEVLPEVGGRVWRIIDKQTDRNLLWTNDAVKPIRVGRRHGWLAGGIEFAYPVGNHGEDTMEPYRAKFREYEDGTASVTVSSFDHFYRLWGSYEISLSPGDARMALTVRLYNPTEVRNRYQIWINAAVKTGEDMQFILPVDYVAGHGFGGVYDWPKMGEDVDLSYWKNREGQLGVFGWDADFLGAYYHDDDYGLLRYSSREFTRGIKMWTWGTRSGWVGEYSLNQGSYNEIQGGRWPTQTMSGFLEPHMMDTWTEYWYPVKGLGGVDRASSLAAMTVRFSPERPAAKAAARDNEASNESPAEEEGAKSEQVDTWRPEQAHIRINVLTAVKGQLKVEAGAKVLLSEAVEAAPGEILTAEVNVKGLEPDVNLSVSLLDESNFTVISYERPLVATPGPEPELPNSIEVAGEGPLWEKLAAALNAEVNEGAYDQARRQYEQIVETDENFAPAWKALGILLYRQQDIEGAEKALAKACAESAVDPEALYYVGLARLDLGHREALETLRAVSGDLLFTHNAKFLLGREALKAGEYARAVEILTEAGRGWSKDPALWDHLAVAARLAGDPENAAEALAAALAAEPLDPFAAVEKLVAAGEAGPENIRAALGADDDLYIEVALFYDAIAQPGPALEVALAGADLTQSGLYYYYLAYLAGRAGDEVAARNHSAKAAEMGTGYVFPHRKEAAAALEYAASLTGEVAYPRYHQGIMLYWLGRHDDAIRTWERLVGRYEVPGLYRNVATAYSRGKLASDLKASIDLFNRALEEEPDDVQIYHELDDLYSAADDRGNRRRLLEKARELFPQDDQIALRTAITLCDRGRYAEAAEIIENHQFKKAHQVRALMNLGYEAVTTTYVGLAMEALDGEGGRRRGGRRGGRAGRAEGRPESPEMQAERERKAIEYLKKASAAGETVRAWFD